MIALALLLAPAAPAPAAPQADAPADPSPGAHVRAFLDRHCVACHNAESASAGLRLDPDATGAFPGAVAADPEAWDYLRERVEWEEMPPAGEAPPGDDARASFVAAIAAALEGDGLADPAPAPLPPAGLRRLTRNEYERAVRDLFGARFRAHRYLPEDAVGHGFDHVGAAQSLSEADFVRYLRAAESVAGRVVPVEGEGPRTKRIEAGAIEARGHHSGAAWQYSRGTAWAVAPLPRAGEYVVRARAFGTQAGPDPVRVVLEIEGGGRSAPIDVPGTRDDPTDIEAELVASAGGDVRVGVRFINDYYVAAESEGERAQDRNLAVAWIEVEGPAGPVTRDGFGAALLDDARERGLTAALVPVARLAWRDPGLGEADMVRLAELTGPDEPMDARLRTAVTGLLASPRFVFKVEEGAGPPDARGAVALTSHEVATRLAGFLWSTVPDAELFARASETDLTDPAIAAALASEMLDDPRADAFVRGFGEQWLQLRALRGKRPDRDAFPGFDQGLRDALAEEPIRVLADSIRADRSLWDLVDGRETVANARLAAHYGVTPPAEPDPDGWGRVSLAETPRRGLLGSAGVLFVTSEATRTSPVRRGRWVLDVLLGAPPPPPPPGVDSLGEPAEGDENLSFRERLERHRDDPDCASCHSRMDPIGFGLESFDAIGAPREVEDDAGTLPDGRSFDGPVELAELLRGEGRFIEAFVERLLVYALGRGLERSDRPVVRAVVAGLDPDHPTIRDAVTAIVATDPFLRIPARTSPRDGDHDAARDAARDAPTPDAGGSASDAPAGDPPRR